MVAAARKNAENTKIEKWDDGNARDWLLKQAWMSTDGSFVVTTRNLAALWGWSKAGVSNLLKTMDLSGQITREVLPNNGGTRITIAGRKLEPVVVPIIRATHATELTTGFSLEDIERIRHRPSKHLTDRLNIAYRGIVYDEPGFEDCNVEHLELIEQALFGLADNDNAAEPLRQAA